ncbi:MAG: DUF493 family protein [Proteobacteria bacterium]|nr:DUF493 family protein [Pseudomonadota bacterium]
MERDQAIELLEEQHTFPGPFQFRFIVVPEAREPAILALSEVIGSSPDEVIESWSRTKKYCALRITFTVANAEKVLDGFACIGTIEGVRLQM